MPEFDPERRQAMGKGAAAGALQAVTGKVATPEQADITEINEMANHLVKVANGSVHLNAEKTINWVPYDKRGLEV